MTSQIIAQTVDIQAQLERNAPMLEFELGRIIERFSGAALLLAGILTFAYMLWGGIDWILAGGDKGKIDAARKKFTQGIVGLALTASTFAVFGIVQYMLGLNIIQL